MNRLTLQERRRICIARRRGGELAPALWNVRTASAAARGVDERPRRRLLEAAMIAALLGATFLAAQTLEFHAPVSLFEALAPQL